MESSRSPIETAPLATDSVPPDAGSPTATNQSLWQFISSMDHGDGTDRVIP